MKFDTELSFAFYFRGTFLTKNIWKCDCYRCRKWNRFVFYLALMPLAKVESICFSPSPHYKQIIGQTGFFALVRQLVKDNENSEFKLVVLHSIINLVLYFAHGGWVWVNTDILKWIQKGKRELNIWMANIDQLIFNHGCPAEK